MSDAFWPSALALSRREIVRFYRQKSRVVGALVPPLVFWLLIGSGLGGSFRHESANLSVPGGMDYLRYFFPGTVVMIVLFTAIFSTISVIEDRHEGFLQSVLVSPAPMSAILFGKILGGGALAFLQGLVFLLLAPWAGVSLRAFPLLYVLGMLVLTALGQVGLGFLIAWRMDSTQGFHAVMNLFLMPLWFLSGALFPFETAPRWLQALMVADPLTYSVAALRWGFYSQDLGAIRTFPTPLACAAVAAGFCAAMFLAALVLCSRREKP